jgi:hypothetical protein
LVSANTVRAVDALEKALDKESFSRIPAVASQLSRDKTQRIETI